MQAAQAAAKQKQDAAKPRQDGPELDADDDELDPNLYYERRQGSQPGRLLLACGVPRQHPPHT